MDPAAQPRGAEVRAELAVALQFDGVLRGVLAIDSHQTAAFSDDDEVFAENLGDLIALRLSL